MKIGKKNLRQNTLIPHLIFEGSKLPKQLCLRSSSQKGNADLDQYQPLDNCSELKTKKLVLRFDTHLRQNFETHCNFSVQIGDKQCTSKIVIDIANNDRIHIWKSYTRCQSRVCSALSWEVKYVPQCPRRKPLISAARLFQDVISLQLTVRKWTSTPANEVWISKIWYAKHDRLGPIGPRCSFD